MKDAKNITLKVTGKGWTARISMDADIVRRVGIQTMLSHTVEDVINTLGVTLPSLTRGRSENLEKPGMTGYSDGTIKSLSTPRWSLKKCISTTKPS